MPKPVTQKDIAQLASVSLNTVSLALRNSERVATDTKKKILEIADQLGYQCNQFASSLAKSKAVDSRTYKATLAVVYGHKEYNPLEKHTIHRHIIEGIKKRGEQTGFRIETFWAYHPDYLGWRLNHTLQSRAIPGIIMVLINENELTLDTERFSFAYAEGDAGMRFHTTASDLYEGSFTVGNKLREYRYKRIGLAVYEGHEKHAQGRLFNGLYPLPFSHPDQPVPPFYLSKKNSEEAFRDWLFTEKPDVVCSVDPIRLQWIRKCGFRVPEDIGFISLDIMEDETNLSGVRRRYEITGSAAVDLIAGQLYRNERGIPAPPKRILISPEWIPGNTIRHQ